MPEKATSFKQVTLMARLLNAKDSYGQWHERGVISLGYSNAGGLHSIEVSTGEDLTSDQGETLQTMFKTGCDKKQLYQLSIPELDLLSSQTACHYATTIGLKERLAFFTDAAKKNIVSFSLNVLDLQYLSSLERTAKKRRIMKEVLFEQWTTTGELRYPEEGQHPNFALSNTEKKDFTSQGHEKKIVEKKKPGEVVEEPQSFFSKYWMQILLALFLLPRLLGTGGDEGGEGGGAQAPARAS